ncbi:N-acetylcysteine deacetylase [Emticicia aquatica]|uniref:N-acetylcysteine deacetylase n=1 Tax=Emticicia aquatica TaxID=1681835 RepID=A0ABN8F3A7_9BACT|nr:amidohydrolase [Emticicia aquatica]CAH0997880.1 N-acetylcysteine deacetylase [Emticicia aquatica]
MTTAIEFRRHIHANPELSTGEKKTSDYVVSELKKLGIKKIHHGFSMHSILAEIDGNESGPTILFRCELDALPIQEESNFAHRSTIEEVSHQCGHDGHAATMFRFAQKLMEIPLKKGKILLFFQSAEEIGSGAKAAIESGIFKQFPIDYAFAFHNFPGFPMGEIIVKKGLFTPCVESGIFELIGKTSHAAEPSKGINPALAIAEIIQYFDSLNNPDKTSTDFFVATPIHIEMGEKAYGTSAGKATIGYTFRNWENEKFDAMKAKIIQKVDEVSNKYKLEFSANWIESFNANNNNATAYNEVKIAAKTQKFDLLDLEKPFEFGEDFGLFTKKYKGAMFGIGSGINQAPLHSSKFDFPDELLEIGSSMFYQMSKQILNK